jgi:hypothetical protein
MARQAINIKGSGEESLLASLIERSAELKHALVDFTCSPRFKRHLAQFMLEVAGAEGRLDEDVAIDIVDRFALQHRLPNGTNVLDLFLASRPDLTAADRDLMLGWRDPVEGIFEIRGKDRDAIVLLNLLDDLEYRTYSNMGPAALRVLPKGGFVIGRLVPIRPVPDAWLVSGRRAHRPGRDRPSGETARTRIPESGQSRAGLGTDAGGQGVVHSVLRRR